MDGIILDGIPAWLFWALTGTAVFLVGISKSGFGTGTGLLSFPLMALVMDVRHVAAVLLPLLILGDINAMYYHRKNRDIEKVKRIYIPSLAGILAGAALWHFTGAGGMGTLKTAIKQGVGFIAVLFAVYILMKERIYAGIRNYRPGNTVVNITGAAAGFVSTMAHAAGPMVAFFLYSQGLKKTVYVASAVWIFTLINLTKLPFYFLLGLIEGGTLKVSLLLAPMIPLGSLAGKSMLDRIPEKTFFYIIMAMVLLTGIQLIFRINILLLLFNR